MTRFSKEQLIEHVKRRQKFARCGCRFSDSDRALDAAVLEIALGALEAEAGEYLTHVVADECGEFSDRVNFSLPVGTKLYAEPPAPVTVPDERYRHLSELYHAQEKRLFKLAQRIKGPSFDKYAHSPSQAIDVLESALFGDSEDTSCVAMLQAGNSPAIPDGWVMVPKEPTTEMANAMLGVDGCSTSALLGALKLAIAAAPQQEMQCE